MTTQPDDKLGQLSALGVAVWLDDISRERLRTGNLAELMRDFHVVGVTSNPTIFASALSKGDAYSEQLADIKVRKISVEQASWEITTYDIRWAADVLRPAYDASDGLDGRVSIEVDPRIARATAETVASAKFLWWAVDRPNLFIKIPATAEGVPAITQTLARGISVNVTLIFSLERYGEVIDAYMAGLEAADAAGHDISKIASVASFFVSRVDTEVDGRLEKIGSADALALRGRAAIENARLAYELFEQRSATSRWEALKARGGRPQRPLWASTSTKNPEYKDTMYVTDLVAPGTVNTMPEPTLHAIAGHGDVRGDTIHGTYDEARRYFEQLEAVGVSYDDVVQVLEDEGVEKFAISWNQLLDTIKSELADEGSR
jgi:transaldolase